MTPRAAALEEPVAFAAAGGRGTIRGIAHPPSAERDTGVSAVLLQGYFSSSHIGPARLYVLIARALAARGIEVIRVDPLGVGDSDGDFRDTTFASELADYDAVIDATRARGRRIALVGHSLGAACALVIGARAGAPLASMLLVSPAVGPFSYRSALFSEHDERELATTGSVERKGTWVSRAFLECITDPALYDRARAVTAPVTLIYGRRDEYFSEQSAQQLAAALPRVDVIGVDDLDHNALIPGSRPRLLDVIERWRP